MDDRELAFDMEFTCCGYPWKVKRSLVLAKRIEQGFGPLEPLAQRLESGALRITEIAKLYGELLKDEREKPTQDDIEEWAFAQGAAWACRQIAVSVYMLVMGSRQLARVAELAARQKGRQAEEAGDGARSPFSTADTSTTPTSSTSPRASAGARPTTGRRASGS